MLSVVIPAFNEEDHIVACLDAFTKQDTNEEFEVILVDNNSTDQTLNRAQQFERKLPLRILHDVKKGRGAARATGFKAAKGDIIFSTDSDTVVPPHWISSLLTKFTSESIVAVSGTYRISDCSWLRNTLFNIIQPTAMLLYRFCFGTYWLTGGNFAIRKPAYERAGGFDAEASSSEDVELSHRVKKIGTIRFFADVPVLTSGRRFQKSLIVGLLEYPWMWTQRFLLKKRNATLSNVR